MNIKNIFSLLLILVFNINSTEKNENDNPSWINITPKVNSELTVELTEDNLEFEELTEDNSKLNEKEIYSINKKEDIQLKFPLTETKITDVSNDNNNDENSINNNNKNSNCNKNNNFLVAPFYKFYGSCKEITGNENGGKVLTGTSIMVFLSATSYGIYKLIKFISDKYAKSEEDDNDDSINENK